MLYCPKHTQRYAVHCPSAVPLRPSSLGSSSPLSTFRPLHSTATRLSTPRSTRSTSGRSFSLSHRRSTVHEPIFLHALALTAHTGHTTQRLHSTAPKHCPSGGLAAVSAISSRGTLCCVSRLPGRGQQRRENGGVTALHCTATSHKEPLHRTWARGARYDTTQRAT